MRIDHSSGVAPGGAGVTASAGVASSDAEITNVSGDMFM
jgi:hypothetical protein